jgi:NitT/TauT family transport system substrate-binding protein
VERESDKTMKKWIWIVFSVVLAFMLMMTGCSSNKSSSSSEPSSSGESSSLGKKIVLGFNPWPGYFPFFIAKEKGFFEKYGLNVDIKLFPVLSDQLTALSGGQLDATGVTVNDLVVPLSKGIDLKAVGVVDISNGGDALVVKKEINSLKDLKGKKMATELGTVDHLLMLVALKQAGLAEGDVQFTNMSMNDAGPALISGKLDAASLYEPFVSNAIKDGANKVLFSSADVPGLITDLIVVKGELVSKRPEDVKNLLRAWFDALAYWKENPDEAMKIMAKAAETPVDEFKGVYDGIKMFTIDEGIKAYEKRDDYSSLFYTANETTKFLTDLDMMSGTPDHDKALDVSFLKGLN